MLREGRRDRREAERIYQADAFRDEAILLLLEGDECVGRVPALHPLPSPPKSNPMA